MVNFGLNSASILGIFLAVAGAGLYFLRSVRPELSRDHDIFFAAVGLLCGLILLFQGWRLDPILQFGQFLLTGSAIFFAVETIRLRGVTTEQARRSTPIVDDERRVSRTRVYTEAELDRLEPYEEDDLYEDNRRLRGYSDSRSGRSSTSEFEEPRETRTRRPSSRSSSKDTTRKRRPRTSPPPTAQYDEWGDYSDERPERPPSTRPRRPSRDSEPPTSSRSPRRPRSSDLSDLGVPYADDSEAIPTDYVDYQPINDEEGDNSDWDRQPDSEDRKDRGSNGDDPPIRFDY